MKKIRKATKCMALGFFLSIIAFVFLALYKEITYQPYPTEISQGINLEDANLGQYYIDFTEAKYLGKKVYSDQNGVPLYQINEKNHYHPVYISQYALGAYEYYLKTGDKIAKDNFLSCADWLRDNLKKYGDFFYWEYTFENTSFPGGLNKVPWFSAMAQGEGSSVLLRAFCETNNEEYLKSARKAIEPIFHDLSEGGISVVKKDKFIFPQEYPTNPPSDILNGAISSYFGVYDYYRVTRDPEIKRFCEIIASSFLGVIDQYDGGYWSFYCRWPKYLATQHYNNVHVTQLRLLYLITGEEKFLKYSQKFKAYQSSWINRSRYVFANHFRQAKEFSWSDIKKIPQFSERIFSN